MSIAIVTIADFEGEHFTIRVEGSTARELRDQINAIPSVVGIHCRARRGARGERHVVLGTDGKQNLVQPGDVFDSGSDAARALGTSQAAIAQAFKHQELAARAPFAFVVKGVLLARCEKLGPMFRNVDWDDSREAKRAAGDALVSFSHLPFKPSATGAAEARLEADARVLRGLGRGEQAEKLVALAQGEAVYDPSVVALAKASMPTTQHIPPPVARLVAPSVLAVAAAEEAERDADIVDAHVPEGDL